MASVAKQYEDYPLKIMFRVHKRQLIKFYCVIGGFSEKKSSCFLRSFAIFFASETLDFH